MVLPYKGSPFLGFEGLNGENASGICAAANNYLYHYKGKIIA